MNSKVFAAAFAVLAMQALCSQASSIRPAADDDVSVRTSDTVEIFKNLNLRGRNKIDDSEITKDVQGILNRLDLARNEKTIQSRGPTFGLLLLQILLNNLNSVEAEIKEGVSILGTAVTKAQEDLNTTAEDTIQPWSQQLQNINAEASELGSDADDCLQDVKANLQNVEENFRKGVEACVQTAFVSAQESLSQLVDIRSDVEALIQNATQVISDCRTAGILSSSCVPTDSAGLLAEAIAVPLRALQLVVQLSEELTEIVSREGAGCVKETAITSGREASEIIEAARQCVADILNAATTAA